MPNDSNYEYYVVDSEQSRMAVMLRRTLTTSHTLSFYTGYYEGGMPVVLTPKPFDVAQDLSTGNVWQYTGAAWVAPSWNSAITFYLGAATTVCERLKSPDTKIPESIKVYIGTDPEVPADLALSDKDLVIKHDLENYSIQAAVFRQDTTTDTVVEVPFPEGYIISTEDGNWTILKNFNEYVGFDFCTIALTWTTNINGAGQYLDFVTSGEAREIAEEVLSSGAMLEDQPFSTTVGDYHFTYTSNGGLAITYSKYHDDTHETVSRALVVNSEGISFFLDEAYGYNPGTVSGAITNTGISINAPDGYTVELTSAGGLNIAYEDAGGVETMRAEFCNGSVLLSAADGGTEDGNHTFIIHGDGVTADGSAVTQISTAFTGTSLGIAELAGGTKYICQSALTALSIGDVAAGCNAAIFFTVAEGAVVTLPGSLGSRFYGEYPNSAGASYCLAITDDMAVCAPAVSAGV